MGRATGMPTGFPAIRQVSDDIRISDRDGDLKRMMEQCADVIGLFGDGSHTDRPNLPCGLVGSAYGSSPTAAPRWTSLITTSIVHQWSPGASTTRHTHSAGGPAGSGAGLVRRNRTEPSPTNPSGARPRRPFHEF